MKYLLIRSIVCITKFIILMMTRVVCTRCSVLANTELHDQPEAFLDEFMTSFLQQR